MQNVKMIARTVEVESNNIGEEVRAGRDFAKDSKLFAGKCAGVCYGSDKYLDEGIRDLEKAKNRSEDVRKSGHHSTFEHSSCSLEIQTNKMTAMFLNSLSDYSTSEKSARYTMMTPETELEKTTYDKWIDKFFGVIKAKHGELFTDKEIRKLAMENARYLISVFTPTYMIYTVSWKQANTICHLIDYFVLDLAAYVRNEFDPSDVNDKFVDDLSNSLLALKAELMTKLSLLDEEGKIILPDKKNIRQRFFAMDFDKTSVAGDAYTVVYSASLACLAQSHRHRTLRYALNLDDLIFNRTAEELAANAEDFIYVPDIIKDNQNLVNEYIGDAIMLISQGVTIQGMKVTIAEQGIVEDFILKCSERLCGRAQHETMKRTVETLKWLKTNRKSLCKSNKESLDLLFDKKGNVVPRCMFKNNKNNTAITFSCTGKDRCKWGPMHGLDRDL